MTLMFARRKIFRFSLPAKLVSSPRSNLNFIQLAFQSLKMSTETAECQKPTIAIAQMCVTKVKASNLEKVKQLVALAKSSGASMLFLPECCDFVGENRAETYDLSETLTGDTMGHYRKLAKDNDMWISLGGIHERVVSDNSQKVFNAHVLLDDKGQIVDVYRKLHLYDVNTPDIRFHESGSVLPGPCLRPPISTPIGRLGLQICYDVRFAEPSLLLRKMGAHILTYPSAFNYKTGQAHWEILLRARAIENQCFVIAPAQVGYHNEKRRSWGNAMVVDHWGKIVAECGGEKELAIATAEINLDELEKTRRNMPCFEQRRGDIYSLTAYDIGRLDAQTDRLFAQHIICKDTIFYETEHSFAFTNLRCVVDGHVLVSTKRVTPRLSGLNCDEMTDLFATVCKIQRMLEEFYKTSAATVTVQDGTNAGQTVPHVHFHVMPRRLGDFGENDQIYVKLEERCKDKVDRTIDERREEAETYREFLKNTSK